MSSVFARLAAGSCSYVGLAICYNSVHPLRVVWDLDETLISSKRLPDHVKLELNTILRVASDRADIEHVDDDALHFMTTARPGAHALLGALRALPGCEQYVSTAASPGYQRNVLALLDPGRAVFARAVANQSSAGKDVALALPPGADPARRRTVLVDNRPSCHSTRPENGVLVRDFEHPAPHDRELARVGSLLLLCWLSRMCGGFCRP